MQNLQDEGLTRNNCFSELFQKLTAGQEYETTKGHPYKTKEDIILLISKGIRLFYFRRGINQVWIQCWNFRTIYGARNRDGIRLSYRTGRLLYIGWRNRFQSSLKVWKIPAFSQERIRQGFKTRKNINFCVEKTSVADPDPYVFGPPGFGSASTRYGSGSESGYFNHLAKLVIKTLLSPILWLLYDFFYLWKITQK